MAGIIIFLTLRLHNLLHLINTLYREDMRDKLALLLGDKSFGTINYGFIDVNHLSNFCSSHPLPALTQRNQGYHIGCKYNK